MPFVEVSLVEGRDPRQLRDLIRTVTDAVAASLDAPPERVRVVVREVPADLWGVGGRTKADGA